MPVNADKRAPEEALSNLRAGLALEQFDIELFARNVTDERGPTRIGPTPESGDAAVLRPPTVRVTLTAEF